MENLTLQLQTKPAIVMYDVMSGHGNHFIRYKKELIKVGKYVKDSTKQAFEVTSTMLDHWVKEFSRWVGNGNRVPIPLSHDKAGDAEANRGWVTMLQRTGDSLFGVLELLDPELALMSDVSIYVPAEVVDGRGVHYIQPITHVALCTNPVVPGLGDFEQLSLSLGDTEMNLKERLSKLLGLKDGDEDAIVSAVETAKATPAKAEDKTLSLAAQTPTNATLVKLVVENRGIKLAGLVKAGLITPAVKTAIEGQYMEPDSLALSLSVDGDDGFDFLVKILTENTPVALGEKTQAQLLELSNTRAKEEESPLVANMLKLRKEAETGV